MADIVPCRGAVVKLLFCHFCIVNYWNYKQSWVITGKEWFFIFISPLLLYCNWTHFDQPRPLFLSSWPLWRHAQAMHSSGSHYHTLDLCVVHHPWISHEYWDILFFGFMCGLWTSGHFSVAQRSKSGWWFSRAMILKVGLVALCERVHEKFSYPFI